MLKLKQLRKKYKISQEKLAQGIGVTQGAVSQWELGNSKPAMENLIAVAGFMGCKVDDLIDDLVERKEES